jgi:LPS O-antigen subunit length determinant protein (WzzB/FepE family)
MENRDNLLGVFQTIYQWRKTIRNVCILALIGSIGLSLMLHNYFQATTIFYPASPQLGNPELMFGNTGQVTDYYGSDRDLDRLAEIATSKELEDFMVRQFKLYDHYDIDSTDKRGPHKVRQEFRSLYTAQKNKNDAIELSIEDTDPQTAANMANAARQKIDEIAQRLTKGSQATLLAAFEENIKRKKSELELLGDSLRRTQAFFGIYAPAAQGEQLSEQLSTAESEITRSRAKLEVLESDGRIPPDTIAYIRANLRAYERQRQQLMSSEPGTENITIKRFNEGFPMVAVLQDLHFQSRKQLSYDLERYNQILATYNTNVPAVLIVEAAEVPLIKSRPKRSILVLAVVIGAFLFTVLAVLVADAYKDIRWKDITQE